MPEEVKFTEEEMKQINDLQQSYVGLQNTLGQMSVNRIRMEQQLDNLTQAETNVKNEFISTQKKERDFVETINKKYGDGNLDLSNGVFTPKSTEEKTDKSS